MDDVTSAALTKLVKVLIVEVFFQKTNAWVGLYFYGGSAGDGRAECPSRGLPHPSAICSRWAPFDVHFDGQTSFVATVVPEATSMLALVAIGTAAAVRRRWKSSGLLAGVTIGSQKFCRLLKLLSLEWQQREHRRTMRQRTNRVGRMQRLEDRRLLAAGFQTYLNVRTADDSRPLTDRFERTARVAVGDAINLEVSYTDLRSQSEVQGDDLNGQGVVLLSGDLIVDVPEGFTPVVNEFHEIVIAKGFDENNNGTMVEFRLGEMEPMVLPALEYYQFPLAAWEDYFEQSTYQTDQYVLSQFSTFDSQTLNFTYVDLSLDRQDLPDPAVRFISIDGTEVSEMPFQSEITVVPPLVNGQVNSSALSQLVRAGERRTLDPVVFEEQFTSTSYDATTGAIDIDFGTFQFFSNYPRQPQPGQLPFDLLSVPVRVTSMVEPINFKFSTSQAVVEGQNNPFPLDRIDDSNATVTIEVVAEHRIEFGNQTLFAGVTDDGQTELFSRPGDGPPVLVADLAGTRSSQPRGFTVVGNEVWFSAELPSGQRELYRTDGTTAGTTLIKNFSGATSSDPADLTVVNDRVFMSVARADGTRRLAVSDGTAVGSRVLSIDGGGALDPADFVVFDGTLFFTAVGEDGTRGLYRSGGTNATTTLIRSTAATKELTVVGGQLFFTAEIDGRSASQRELFVSDGTADGTRLVRDLFTGSANPANLFAVGNTLAFTAELPSGERELFRSDGTAEGTTLVVNLNGDQSANPRNFQPVVGGLVFDVDGPFGTRDRYFSNLDRLNRTAIEPDVVFNASWDAFRDYQVLTAAKINPRDLNDDGRVTPIDALRVINQLRRDEFETQGLNAAQRFQYDVSGDGEITPLDALQVINELRRQDREATSIDATVAEPIQIDEINEEPVLVQ